MSSSPGFVAPPIDVGLATLPASGISTIVEETVVDPVGPEFMAPPPRAASAALVEMTP